MHRAIPIRRHCCQRCRASIRLHQAQRSITPGQACVLYQGDLVVGGGAVQIHFHAVGAEHRDAAPLSMLIRMLDDGLATPAARRAPRPTAGKSLPVSVLDGLHDGESTQLMQGKQHHIDGNGENHRSILFL